MIRLNSLIQHISEIHHRICALEKEKKLELGRVIALQKKGEEGEGRKKDLEDFLLQKKKELQQLENELKVIEIGRDRAKEAQGMAVNQDQLKASETQYSTLNEKHQLLEESALELMDLLEVKEDEYSEVCSFLKGHENVLVEIQDEVHKNVANLDEEIQGLNGQIEEEYLKELRPDFRDDILQIKTRLFFNSPFSKVEKRHCRACGSSLNSTQVTDLERGEELQICSGCGRIFYTES